MSAPPSLLGSREKLIQTCPQWLLLKPQAVPSLQVAANESGLASQVNFWFCSESVDWRGWAVVHPVFHNTQS